MGGFKKWISGETSRELRDARNARRVADGKKPIATWDDVVSQGKLVGATAAAVIAEAEAAHAGRFSGVYLDTTNATVSYKGEYRSVIGATAQLESSGQIDRRSTVTRTAVGAVAFGVRGAVVGAVAKKKVDHRESYLTISGEEFEWVIKVDPDRAEKARQFAAAINVAGRTAK